MLMAGKLVNVEMRGEAAIPDYVTLTLDTGERYGFRTDDKFGQGAKMYNKVKGFQEGEVRPMICKMAVKHYEDGPDRKFLNGIQQFDGQMYEQVRNDDGGIDKAASSVAILGTLEKAKNSDEVVIRTAFYDGEKSTVAEIPFTVKTDDGEVHITPEMAELGTTVCVTVPFELVEWDKKLSDNFKRVTKINGLDPEVHMDDLGKIERRPRQSKALTASQYAELHKEEEGKETKEVDER